MNLNQVVLNRGMVAFMCLWLGGFAPAWAGPDTEPARPITSIRVTMPESHGPLMDRTAAIFARVVAERCNATVVTTGVAPFTVELAVKGGIGKEGFAIADGGAGRVRITGNDEKGVLYGVGKFLHTSRFDQKGFTPSMWRGTSVPKKTCRGMYFFPDYAYANASTDFVVHYLEDMALWGCNAFGQWWHYVQDGSLPGLKLDSMAGKRHLERFRIFYKEAKALGMETMFFQAYMPCPYKPQTLTNELPWFEGVCQAFESVGFDYLGCFPYDPGGCPCSRCAPWGANGFITISKSYVDIFHKYFPKGKIVIGTWYYTPEDWLALDKAWATPPNWVDYLEVGTSHAKAEKDWPSYPLIHGAPGKLPMMDFPEVSMIHIGRPDPEWFEHIWKKMGDKVVGGFPYTEGVRTDINNVLCLQFYWNDRPALDTVREYASFEYLPDVADEVTQIILDLANSRPLIAVKPENKEAYFKQVDALQARLNAVEARLTPQARNAWRWKLQYFHFANFCLMNDDKPRVVSLKAKIPVDIYEKPTPSPTDNWRKRAVASTNSWPKI